MSAGWAAAAQGAASLGGSILGYIGNNRNNNANMELAKYSFEKDKEMWNMQNEYNSPTNQMARLKSAGLNPNMVYGNGSAVNVASGAPKMQTPTMHAYQGYNLGISDAIGTYMQMKSNSAQTELAKTQKDAVEADIDTKRLQQANMVINNSKSALDLQTAQKMQYDVLRQASQKTSLNDLETQGKTYQNKILDYEHLNKGVEWDSGRTTELNKAQLNSVRMATDRLKQTMDIDQFDQDLYKTTGMTKKDGVYWRILRAALGAISPNLGGKLDRVFNPK